MKHTDKCMHNPDFDNDCSCVTFVWIVCEKYTSMFVGVYDSETKAIDFVSNNNFKHYYTKEVVF